MGANVRKIFGARLYPLHIYLTFLSFSSGCTVASDVVGVVGVVVAVSNRSQVKTSKCTCLIFGVSI